MKAIMFGFGVFGSVFFAPNADKMIGEGWSIHPFSVAVTLMVVMGAWILTDLDAL